MRLALALAVLLACPVAADAVTVTVGRQSLPSLSPDGEHTILCSSPPSPCVITAVPRVLSAPSDLETVPSDGFITSWRFMGSNGGAGPISTWRLRVLRLVGDAWTGAGTSPPAEAAAGNGSSISLAAPLRVLAGDRIGVTITNSGTASSAWLMREPIMGSSYDTFGTIADGTSEARTEVAGYEPLVSADVLLDPPVVTGVSPASGPTAGGQQVTISGDHFTGASSVTFGGQPASGVSVLSDEVLTTTTPASAAGTVDVIVAAQSGQSTASDAARYTYASVAPDATPPLIGSLGMSPARFLSANTGPALIAAVVGTRVTYTLSEPATTTFKVQKARRVKRHTRYVTMKGRLTHAGAQGQNRFRFMGRLRNRQLRPGKYRLVAVGKDAAGNRSKPVRRKFRIVPAPR